MSVWLLRRLRPPSRVLAFSHPSRAWRDWSSLIPVEDVIASLSYLLYAGGSFEAVRITEQVGPATLLPFGHGVSASFAILQSRRLRRFLFVSIGRRVCGRSPFWLRDWPRCRRASHPRQCHSLTQAAQPSCHCSNTALNEQHIQPLVGTLLQL